MELSVITIRATFTYVYFRLNVVQVCRWQRVQHASWYQVPSPLVSSRGPDAVCLQHQVWRMVLR